ncbi:MAG TPA: ATP-binding protein, partial [Candidatus Wallbacteria bacterium]|nr:ATP-binding protein [Candidatus Wallbacteria bacterium]
SRTKSAFVANISHEIRTPLNSILGFSELFYKTGINDEQRELLGYVKTSGQALLTLINDVLDLSKIEAGKLDIERVEFDINRILWEVAGIVTPVVKKKDLNFIILNDFDIDFNVFGDPSRLRQVLLNLLGNAVKFTDKGKISISTKILSTKDNTVFIEFVVTDEGPGIAADKINSIFKPFTQADVSITRRYGGTGLGLAISNQLVKLMGGGDILYESSGSRGSKFYFALEFSKGSSILKTTSEKKHRENPTGADRTAPLYFLVVEDNLANQKLFGKILKTFGHNTNFADNGATAVELIAKEKYDVVLMDVQMPVMDGITAARTVRNAGYKGIIIAMTASTMKGDEQECLNAGMDAYLSKPVDIERLENAVKSAIEKRAETSMKKSLLAGPEKKAEDNSGETQALDVEKLRKNMAGKMELMSDAVEMLLQYYPKYCLEIKKSIENKDAPALKMSAHKLKGTALNASACAISAMLLLLENIGKSGRTEGASEIFENLEPEFERYKTEAAKAGLLTSGS